MKDYFNTTFLFMSKKIYLFLFAVLCCSNLVVSAQVKGLIPQTDTAATPATSLSQVRPEEKVPMADILYQNGKIYLVVLVLLTIFAGIIFYLVRLDRKLSRLENQK
jgi:hypothetical protein